MENNNLGGVIQIYEWARIYRLKMKNNDFIVKVMFWIIILLQEVNEIYQWNEPDVSIYMCIFTTFSF